MVLLSYLLGLHLSGFIYCVGLCSSCVCSYSTTRHCKKWWEFPTPQPLTWNALTWSNYFKHFFLESRICSTVIYDWNVHVMQKYRNKRVKFCFECQILKSSLFVSILKKWPTKKPQKAKKKNQQKKHGDNVSLWINTVYFQASMGMLHGLST